MKNIIKKIVAVAVIMAAIFIQASAVSAATTVSLTPAMINITAGQTFTVSISINPQGGTDYTEKVEIKFPKDLLSVTAFTPAASWIAMNQPGYDAIDNANGVMIKTAGFPAGINSPALFGTITFYAKASGTAPITVGSNSLSFQTSTQTAITGNTSIATIQPKPATPASSVTPKVPAKTTPDTGKTLSATTSTTTLSQNANAAGSVDALKNSIQKYNITIVILCLIILALISYIVYIRKNQNKI